jgi:DNA-binding HxlR family transcriptional regulator
MRVMATSSASSLDAALARVGDRWTLLIVDALLQGPRRFNELIAEVDGIAPNILSQRLKHLEREAMITARPYSRRPTRFSYELSGSGRDLASALRLLAEWGAGHGEDSDPPRHAACGTPMETRWYCPTCARTVDDHEDADLRFV